MPHQNDQQSAVHHTSQSRDRSLTIKAEVKSAVYDLVQADRLLTSNYAHIALDLHEPLDLSFFCHRNRFGYHIR